MKWNKVHVFSLKPAKTVTAFQVPLKNTHYMNNKLKAWHLTKKINAL